MSSSPIIIALDVEKISEVERIVKRLGAAVDFYKVGLKLYTRYGPEVLKFLQKKKKRIFLDLKFHDIPNTVAEACREAVRLKVQMLTLHACGGGEMMKLAAAALREESQRQKITAPWLMAVTVLTSMDSENLKDLGVTRSLSKQVLHLAKLAHASRVDGVICSPHEIEMIRQNLPKKFKIVTPGIRPVGTSLGDQKRVKTPQEALSLGANAVVMGRPVLEAKNPVKLVQEILLGLKA